jgi:hypothetical protein
VDAPHREIMNESHDDNVIPGALRNVNSSDIVTSQVCEEGGHVLFNMALPSQQQLLC